MCSRKTATVKKSESLPQEQKSQKKKEKCFDILLLLHMYNYPFTYTPKKLLKVN